MIYCIHMDKKTIILIVMLFGLIVVGMFAYAFIKKSELAAEVTMPVPQSEPEVVSYPMVDRIDAKHYFDGVTHTFVGEIDLPTPCDLLTTKSIVRESSPEQIELDFKVINNADLCIQQITTQRFSVTATASKEAEVSAVFMGRVIPLNLIPAAPGEKPEDFELFIKG
jgi:hypothetical protein